MNTAFAVVWIVYSMAVLAVVAINAVRKFMGRSSLSSRRLGLLMASMPLFVFVCFAVQNAVEPMTNWETQWLCALPVFAFMAFGLYVTGARSDRAAQRPVWPVSRRATLVYGALFLVLMAGASVFLVNLRLVHWAYVLGFWVVMSAGTYGMYRALKWKVQQIQRSQGEVASQASGGGTDAGCDALPQEPQAPDEPGQRRNPEDQR